MDFTFSGNDYKLYAGNAFSLKNKKKLASDTKVDSFII